MRRKIIEVANYVSDEMIKDALKKVGIKNKVF